MHLGLGSFALGWAAGVRGFPPPRHPLTPAAFIGKAAALGLRLVQFADNLPIDHLSDDELDGLRRHADALGVTIELGIRGIAPEHVRRHLAIATRLRAGILRIVVDTNVHHPSPDEIAAILRALLPECEERNVTLGIENHDHFTAWQLRELFERVEHPRVGLCYDTANSLGCLEGPGHVLEVCGAHVVSVHLKDVTVRRLPHNFGFLVEGCPAGSGQLDIPAIVRQVRETGRQPNFILELWPAPEPSIEQSIAKEDAWLVESVRYLRQHLPT